MLEKPRDQIAWFVAGSITAKKYLPRVVSSSRCTRLPGHSPSSRSPPRLTCSSLAVPPWKYAKRRVRPVKWESKRESAADEGRAVVRVRSTAKRRMGMAGILHASPDAPAVEFRHVHPPHHPHRP